MEANETTAPVVALEQPRQNGVSRPFPGTKTGLVWDYADAIYKARLNAGVAHPVPVIAEVQKLYSNVVGAVPATCRQQFQFWCVFHDLKDAWRARVEAEGQEVDAEKIAAKKAKEAEKVQKAEAAAAKAAARVEKLKADAEAKAQKAKEMAEKAEAAAKSAREKAESMLAKAGAAATAAAASAAPTETPAADKGKGGKQNAA
jgi:hypothetical protein